MNDVAGGIWQGVPQASRGQRKGRMAECVSMCFCMMARVWNQGRNTSPDCLLIVHL